MSRLTLPHYSGKGHYMKCSEQFGCSGECADCEELEKLGEKLADYEDKEALNQQTNEGRMRAMRAVELAEFLCSKFECSNCVGAEFCNSKDGKANGLVKWLQQPAGEE